MELSNWFKGFEKGISRLNPEQRTLFFSECGKNCVKCGTLQIYQELYKKAKGDLNTFFFRSRQTTRRKKRNYRKRQHLSSVLYGMYLYASSTKLRFNSITL